MALRAVTCERDVAYGFLRCCMTTTREHRGERDPCGSAGHEVTRSTVDDFRSHRAPVASMLQAPFPARSVRPCAVGTQSASNDATIAIAFGFMTLVKRRQLGVTIPSSDPATPQLSWPKAIREMPTSVTGKGGLV